MDTFHQRKTKNKNTNKERPQALWPYFLVHIKILNGGEKGEGAKREENAKPPMGLSPWRGRGECLNIYGHIGWWNPPPAYGGQNH